MAKSKTGIKNGISKSPQSAEIANRGIQTGADFATLMGALMADVLAGHVKPEIANATCKAGSQLLRVVEMQLKHGTSNGRGSKVLQLAMHNRIFHLKDSSNGIS